MALHVCFHKNSIVLRRFKFFIYLNDTLLYVLVYISSFLLCLTLFLVDVLEFIFNSCVVFFFFFVVSCVVFYHKNMPQFISCG